MAVITCEESLDKMRGAEEAPPELMYVDRGCCRVHGVSHLEQLFSEWADSGMKVRLDIFHWIHRFDAAVRTDHHPKYALFKSALSAAVFSYNKDDMALLIRLYVQVTTSSMSPSLMIRSLKCMSAKMI